MKKYTVYIDESGNTGSNLLDFSQPIFTFVGIGIDHENMIPILLSLDQIKTRFRLPKDHALHAKKLTQKTREKLSREILELLIQYRFDFFYSVVEKKFTIATYVDSEFFDPVYNDKCDNSWTLPSHKHNERADFFYNNLTEQAFLACGKAFQTGEGVKEAYELVNESIKGKKWDLDLYDIIQGAESHLEKLASDLSSFNSSNAELGIPAGVAQSPNFFTFCGLINKIEYFYSIRENSSVHLVFDSAAQFNAAFLKFFERFRDAEKMVFHFKGKVPRIFGFENVRSFTDESRKNSAFLQMSDIVATAIKDVVQKVYLDDGTQHYSEVECFILFLTIGHWEKFEDRFCDFIVSSQLLKKLYSTFYDTKRMAILRNMKIDNEN